MNVMKSIFSGVMALLLLAACTTNPANLKPVTAETSLNLKTPFEFTVDRSSMVCKYLYKYVLAPGSFVSKFQDETGIYYVGQTRSLREQQLVASCSDGTLFTGAYDAGVFVPHDQQKPAKVFVFLKTRAGSPQPAAPAETYDPKLRAYQAVAAIAAAMEDGNLWFPPQPAEPSLRKALAP
jgi:hypothetical protein